MLVVGVLVVWVELEVVGVDPMAVVTGISAVRLKRRKYDTQSKVITMEPTVNHYSLA